MFGTGLRRTGGTTLRCSGFGRIHGVVPLQGITPGPLARRRCGPLEGGQLRHPLLCCDGKASQPTWAPPPKSLPGIDVTLWPTVTHGADGRDMHGHAGACQLLIPCRVDPCRRRKPAPRTTRAVDRPRGGVVNRNPRVGQGCGVTRERRGSLRTCSTDPGGGLDAGLLLWVASGGCADEAGRHGRPRPRRGIGVVLLPGTRHDSVGAEGSVGRRAIAGVRDGSASRARRGARSDPAPVAGRRRPAARARHECDHGNRAARRDPGGGEDGTALARLEPRVRAG